MQTRKICNHEPSGTDVTRRPEQRRVVPFSGTTFHKRITSIIFGVKSKISTPVGATAAGSAIGGDFLDERL